MREVRRVLRNDGTLWLNLGDSYAGGGNGGHQKGEYFHGHTQRSGDFTGQAKKAPPGLKPKDLVGIPWMAAFALRTDGWWLRSDIIWSKPNPMPESVRDRPTKAHEYIFLLTKSAKCYYDAEAIKEPAICGDPRKPYCPGQVDGRGDGHARGGGKIRASVLRGGFNGKTEAMSDDGRNAFRSVKDWRNRRSVWTVSTYPVKEAHFATYPPDLIEPCILAGCPEGGTVLDPFGGSGTTGLAAIKHGRKALLIELNPEYIGIAEGRMRQHFSLFVGQAAST
jgi:DNA modification methylase